MKINIYSWYGDPKLVAPYTHNETIEGDPWAIAKEFFDKGLTVSLRPIEEQTKKEKRKFVGPTDECDVLLCVSESGWGQR